MATTYVSYEAATPVLSEQGYATRWIYQTFTTTQAFTAATLSILATKSGNPGLATLALYATSAGKPTGSALASGTYDATLLDTTTPAWFSVTLGTAVDMADATVYALVSYSAGADSSNDINIYGDNTSGYAGGGRGISTDGGSVWGSASATHDMSFRIIGVPTTNPPATDAYVAKKWCGVASGEFWYEDTAGNLVQLAASVGQLDTTDFLSMVGAYGKAFIANGANLKIVDFVNVKITTTNVGANPPDANTILTGGTSGAQMIVDYIDALTGATVIYGRLIDSTKAFEAETVTGTDTDGNAISFTGTAQVTGPHWYDWTVFGQDSSFGTMPAKANLVCLYRGRMVLSGNKIYPHQWYMAKVNRTFNFVYSATDPLTAVAGHNTTAGEVGDTVEALVPYGDSYLVFGCSSSVHVLDGDPAFSGSIDEKSANVGFYGAHSWCKDEEYNLYFFGTNGIYKMEGGVGKPRNISDIHLPNLITDWALNKATKRVVMVYDSENDGILICNTTLATGVNLNYFYSFKTGGFYPETYPTTNAVFSAFIYDALTSTYSGLCLGCNDGYIRDFDPDAKDDVGATDPAISSYVTYPIFPLSDDDDLQGRVVSTTIELAGGGLGGRFSDSDGCIASFYVGNNSEGVLEKMKATTAWATGTVYAVGDLRTYSGVEYICITAHTSDATGPPNEEPDTNTTDWEPAAIYSQTISGGGRQQRIRERMTGAFLGVKFANSTAGETFAVNKIAVQVRPSGRIK